MKLLSRTVTFNERQLSAELGRLQKRFDAYERFAEEVHDVMEFMDRDEDYNRLDEALAHLNASLR